MKNHSPILTIIILLIFNSSIWAQYEFTTYQPEQLKEDLSSLYQQLDSVHFNLYHKHNKAQFDTVYHEIMQNLSAPLNDFQFYWDCELPLFNLMKDAHSAAIFPFDLNKSFSKQGGKFLPLEVEINDGKIYLKQNLSKKKIPHYSSILAVNGIPTAQILTALRKLSNNEISDSEHRYMAYFFPRILYWLYGFDKEFKVKISTPKGKIRSFKLQGIALAEYKKQTNPDYEFYYLEDSIGVLDINRCEGRENFASFCDSIFSILNKNETPFLIIDIRDNGGGSTYHGDTLFSYLTNAPYTQYGPVDLKISPRVSPNTDSTYFTHYDKVQPRARHNPKLYAGKIYMLANKNSFSSAAMLAATFKCYNMGTLVGQETGGVQIFFDEPLLLTLANTKLRFLASYQYRYCSCGRETHRGIIPDYSVEWSLEDKIKQLDSELELIKKLINNE
jgi:hypothetical protein